MSGRKNILPAFKLCDSTSLRNTFKSSPVTINTATHVGINVATSGVTANSGTFGVQHRIYKNLNEASEWVDLTLNTTPTLSDADTVALLDLRIPPGQVRLRYDAGDAEVQTLTFLAKADTDDGDTVVITDGSGLTWAFAADTTGAAASVPTSAEWAAIPAGRKVYCDISGATTAASVAALAETALDALTGFTAACVTDDSAADGTMTLTMQATGLAADPQSLNADGTGVGTITGVSTSAPDGTVTVWVTGNSEG